MTVTDKSKDRFFKIDEVPRYTEVCPFDANILHFTGDPERTLKDGFYGAKCRLCQRYFKIPKE